MKPEDYFVRFPSRLHHGHTHRSSNTRNTAYWTAKPDSHDDGERCGLFLGGIGAPVCSRNIDGVFDRWHLQTGYHVYQPIESAFFGVAWRFGSDTERSGYFRLSATGEHAFTEPGTGRNRSVYSLVPVIHEHYSADDLPFEIVLELFTPLLRSRYPNNASESVVDQTSLPVFFATIAVRNRTDTPVEIDTVAFWPNLLGWRAQRATPCDHSVRSWPGQTHAGNTAKAIPGGVVQERSRDRRVVDEMEGQIAIISSGHSDDRTSVVPCLKAGTTKIDRSPSRQGWTVPWAEQQFSIHHRLPQDGLEWRMHWDEAMASGVHRGATVLPNTEREFTYTIAMDIPIVRFGEDRRWFRKYTANFGTSGTNALEIARLADAHRDEWREEIDTVHGSMLNDSTLPTPISAAMLNELYFVNGGGTAWVHRWASELDQHLEPPLLGTGEHAAILEGFDVGYYYYNTTDLWPYAWHALNRWWPEFTRGIFHDLTQTIELDIPEKRMIYRTETPGQILEYGKLPHDVGAVMEDPWHRINGYQMRDDSNLWKDHNPGFIVSYYLYVRTQERPFTDDEWRTLRSAGEFFLRQDGDADGLLYHDEFGDSTWDNLGIEGIAAYSGGMSLAALAVLVSLSQLFSDAEFEQECRARLSRGIDRYLNALWDEGRFRLCDRGKYTDSTMADAMIGFFLCDLAGLHDLNDRIGRDRIVSHLRVVVENNVTQYHRGRYGALLVAAPGQIRFSGDGGDELQVNEVLIGSTWMLAAMLAHYGLMNDAVSLTESLAKTIYGTDRNGLGLQFRTPAALDGSGRFRAPMNMRPLSIWFLSLAFAKSENK